MTILPDVEPDLLRAFVAVAETGSFTAAAEVVGRSQSAVSQKVLRLEDILQMRVFDRTSRSLRLTCDGERVLVAGKRLLAHYQSFMHELRDPPKVSLLRLGISENLVQTQLPRLLSRFSHLHPDVQLELTTTATEELLVEYEARRLDIIIAKRRQDGSPHPGRVIWREQLVWTANSDYRADDRRPVRLVMRRPPCIYRAVMTEALDVIGREWMTACTASNLLGIEAAVLGGLGVTVLGKSFVQNGMKILPTSERWPALPVAEVSVIGKNPALQHIVQPLVALLTEALLDSSGLTLETPLTAENGR
ncbi:LysR family transcriptional regulator [Neorhizobium sp. P12A]|uniref:LysR family transcriptional regulator n=1 Tax=Neorhizobium sp. P12A TaxID=2268027 RepID=UPI0011F031BF|nr:LysR family transcriptional regulator [Neorhizobium sp. P12A]KAA0693402.1 LysR family transcriptional regulator [Neorhizobium sp. P12A]